jgi:predicted nucleotidyltransferase
MKELMIDDITIAKAVELLRRAAPGARVIRFGSHARGEAREESDLDFLVVEPELQARREEMVRLRGVLRPLGVPAYVLVVSQRTFEDWADVPGTVLYEAAHEGRVFEAAA